MELVDRSDPRSLIEQRTPERVTASHCESPDKRNGMVDARATAQRLQGLDEDKNVHNAENLIITDVLKEIVRAPQTNTAFPSLWSMRNGDFEGLSSL